MLAIAVGTLAPHAHANVVITDFFSQNPMSFAYPGATWAAPVKQFQFFTTGSVSGQEVVPIGGGSPTVSGGGGILGLNLDLLANDSLQLTARLLPANQAVFIQVLLFDADGTHLRFSFPVTNFNTSTFSSAVKTFSSATTTAVGSTPGFDKGHVVVYEVQGDFFDAAGAGTALMQVQLDDLSAVGALGSAVPEPHMWPLVACLLAGCQLFRRRRNPKPRGV